jgi:basic amino acid/polyamine antiporter, APA family
LVFAVPVFILVLCFAEAASYFDEPGGAYLYTRTAFGDFLGFETGWMNWLARVTSLASLSVGFVVALGAHVTEVKTGAPRAAILIGLIVLLAAIHLAGVRYGAFSIYLLTLAKLVPLLGFIVVALIVWKSNPIPSSLVIPPAGTKWAEASLFMLFLYAGFENLGVPAGEYKNPRRHLPWALLIGTVMIAVIYALTQLGAMSALSDLSQSKTPIASAAEVLIGPAGAIIITTGAMLSMAGTNSGTMLEGSRMLYALARDRNLGPLAYVHPRFRAPSVAIVVHASLALALALYGSFRELALLSAVARLATYLMTCLALPRLRKLHGRTGTPGLVIPILGMIVSLVFVLNLDREKIIIAMAALGVGALVYGASRRTVPPVSPAA